MQGDPDREKHLRRRLYCEGLHLKYLLSLATDPTSIDSEVERRQAAIEDLQSQIEMHLGQISRLISTRDNVHEHIVQSEAKIRSLKQLQKKELIKKIIEEYIAVNKRLQKEL